MYKLDPLIDGIKIMRVVGRIGRAKIDQDVKQLAILLKKSHVTDFITRRAGT